MKRIGAFSIAVLATYVTAALLYSQLNLANLVEMGLDVPFSVRLSAALNDVTGLFILIPVLAIGFAIAFGVTHQILRVLPQLRHLGYMLAGFAAFWAIDYSLYKVMNDSHILAVTRTSIGAVTLYLTGALGGYVFVRLLPTPSQ